MNGRAPGTDQSRAEEIANSVSHGVGAALSLAALALLVVFASLRGDAWTIVSFSVYGSTLFLLYLVSTLYHALRPPRAKRFFKLLDHSAIFLLIAGTYTPIVLGPMRGPWGWTLFGLIWGMAVAGILSKIFLIDRMKWVSVLFYIAMGWLVLIAIDPLRRVAAPGLMAWILAGGLCYTLGVIFYAWKGLRFHHAIWHLFVLAGSICHFFGILLYVTPAGLSASATPERIAVAVAAAVGGAESVPGQADLSPGDPIFIRIFKEEGELEVWLKSGDSFRFVRQYEICSYSGDLGPKLRQGDRQSPEGFYFVTPERMNPNSKYHLAFNIGYPNEYDRFHGRTGDFIMVHGACVSIGCYAMTDGGIEQIYGLADAALRNGQPFFRVHIFPFRMTAANMERHERSRWYEFWVNLKQGYDRFERDGVPPSVRVEEGKYVFDDPEAVER